MLKISIKYLRVLSSLIFLAAFIIAPEKALAAEFSISNSTPFLGEEITITGSGLTPSHTYYLYNLDGGVEKDYTDTTFEGESAKQFTGGSVGFETGWYYSHAYEEFDKVLVFLRYYDAAAVTPYFRIGASDIYWTNGGGAVQTFNINSLGSETWTTYTNAFEKDRGVPSFEWNFVKVASNNVYIDKIQKYPMWEVTTDDSGNLNETINAPRAYSRSVDLDFTFNLYDPTADEIETIGAITLDPKYDQYRSAKDMLEFHYIHNRPETLEGNFGKYFSNQVRRDVLNHRTSDWDAGFVGGIFSQLGRDDLRDESASRIKDTIRTGTPDLRCYPIGGGNYTDCAFAGWVTVRPTYEESGNAGLRQAMVDILAYLMVGYNPTANNFFQSAGAVDTFWADAGGGKPQFFWYMGDLLGDDTYKNHAKTMINFMIDTLQTPEGWYRWRYNFSTEEFVEPLFWDGAQGWALTGLREFRDQIVSDTDEQALVTKINSSLERASDSLSTLPLSDLRDDYRRSSYIAYNLLKLSQESDTFSEDKRNSWASRGEELFILALDSMNSEYDQLNTYGLTYTPASVYALSFPDYYLLRLLNEIYPDAVYFPNNTGSSYPISKDTDNDNIYQAFLDNTNDWSNSTSYYTQASSSGTLLKGTSEPDRVVKYLKRDMSVSLISGTVDIAITDWTESDKEWTMSSSTDQNVDIEFSGLVPNRTYQVYRDGSIWGNPVNTDSSGSLSFTYNGGFSTHSFQLQEGSSGNNNSPGNSAPGAPSCNDVTPMGIPDLFQIDVNSSQAILYFTQALGSVDKYYIAYGLSPAEYLYSTEIQTGSAEVLPQIINQLAPNTSYYFIVRSGNGCMPGEWSNEMNAKTSQSGSTRGISYFKNFPPRILSIFPKGIESRF